MKAELFRDGQKIADVDMLSHSGGDTETTFYRGMSGPIGPYTKENPVVIDLLCAFKITISDGNYELRAAGTTLPVYINNKGICDEGKLMSATLSS